MRIIVSAIAGLMLALLSVNPVNANTSALTATVYDSSLNEFSTMTIYDCQEVSFSQIPWHTVSWGRAKICFFENWFGNGGYGFQTQTQDILTDGYCVHIEYNSIHFNWRTLSGSTSCGLVTTSAYATYTYGYLEEVRLIRGTGTPGIGVNYTTIWLRTPGAPF